jgi:hypothetical protein
MIIELRYERNYSNPFPTSVQIAVCRPIHVYILLGVVSYFDLITSGSHIALRYTAFFSPMAQRPLGGLGLLIVETLRSHSDTAHSVGLLWTSDQPVAGTSTC